MFLVCHFFDSSSARLRFCLLGLVALLRSASPKRKKPRRTKALIASLLLRLWFFAQLRDRGRRRSEGIAEAHQRASASLAFLRFGKAEALIAFASVEPMRR
uniref:Uncharacterized protein n=1 Tax=Pediastrum duplex TaxID=3105 RepID=A0A2U8GJD9_PEDDU|nr:hypothetical protein [Pediastrum duplex]